MTLLEQHSLSIGNAEDMLRCTVQVQGTAEVTDIFN
jgi:hypothetical protein